MRIVLKLFFLIGLATAQVDVVPLIEEWQLDEMVKAFTLVTWSTLVRDGDHTIIVDLPQANETDVAMKLTHALKGKNLTPDGIQKLVFTHDRPKNNEHKSIFPNAHQFFSTYEYNRETFVRTGLYENGKIQLTPNVELWYTPGHSSEDITVMVNNVENRGRVAITGNLIYDLHDIVDSKLWESRAQHLHAGLKRRRKVICHANYIIPGHGAIFQVTEKHRNAVKCKDEHGQEGGESEKDAPREQRRHRDQERQRERQRRDEAYQRSLALWQQDHQAQRPDSGQVQSGLPCCTQSPCPVNQPLCGSSDAVTSAGGGCCMQQPCQYQQPPCSFASSCCQQNQPCEWNQLRCRPANCNQPSGTQCDQKEIHHHYVGSETEVLRNHIRKEQNDLTKSISDQQKMIRQEHDKVSQMFLGYMNDMNTNIERYLQDEVNERKEFNQMLWRHKQEMDEISRRHSEEIHRHLARPTPIIRMNSTENIQKMYEEHKRNSDHFWRYQEHLQATKKAHEETTYKKTVKAGQNYTTTSTRENCNNRTEGGCNMPCAQGCSSGCVENGCVTQRCAQGGCVGGGCSGGGCTQGCAQGGCGGGGCSGGGCVQGYSSGCSSGCSGAVQPASFPPHRHAPGQRHYGGRRRLRREEADERRQQRKLQKLQQSLI